jgi:hypothetical protein
MADGGTQRGGGGHDNRWRHPARWKRPQQSDGGDSLQWSQPAGLLVRCSLGTAVRKDKADATKELGDEDGGVALRFSAVDPLQRRRANLRWRGRAARAGASGACGRHKSRSERRMRRHVSRSKER